MTHKPTNPWARRTGLLAPPTTTYSRDFTEVVSERLYQSRLPTTELLKELRPDHIVDCRWFDDDGVKLPADMNRLSSTADAVTTLVRSGHRILIHCLGGRNRSSLVVCLVLMRLNPDWTGSQAVAVLEAKRPGILTNPVFRKYLTSLNNITDISVQP